MLTKITLFLTILAITQSKLVSLKEKAHDPLFENETYYSGYVPISDRGNMFYLMFDSRSDPDNDPLIIFFTGGGGGGSSLMACFHENGPFGLNPASLSLFTNPHSWNNAANLMFVEQPLGIGFSEVTRDGGHPTTLLQVAEDFYAFLNGFYAAYPQFNGRKLYIAGEQVGGRWAVLTGAYIAVNGTNKNINLAGVSIGDGWINPSAQYPQYAEWSLRNNFINISTYQALNVALRSCKYLINNAPFDVAYPACDDALKVIQGNPPQFNPYNSKLPCQAPPFCYDFSAIIGFVNQPSVLSALGREGHAWSVFSPQTYMSILPQYLVDVSPLVATLLSKDIPVLAYYGEDDFDMNWLGGEAWAHELNWIQHEAFNKAHYHKRPGYGEFKTAGAFTYYKIANSGQLIPMDRPDAASDMINQFIKTGGLQSENHHTDEL